MTPLVCAFLVGAAIALCVVLAANFFFKAKQGLPFLIDATPPQPAPAPAPGPHMVIISGVLVNVDNVGSIDARDPDNVLISAGHELLDFHGQDAKDIVAYFKIPVPQPAPASHKHSHAAE